MRNEQPVEQAAERLIADFSGEAAFLARNLATGTEIGYRPDAMMPTASTIKLLVLTELYRHVEVGAVRLDDPVTMLAADHTGGSGILKDLSPALVATVHDHAVLMTALSDNISTAVLVRLLGRERILQSAREWGMTDTTATFGSGDIRAYATSTPRDIVRLLALIATDALISPAACAAMRDILLTQQYHDQIARYLPFNPYARSGSNHPGPVIVRSKSGFSGTAGVRVDAGIVELPNDVRYVVCLMTEGSNDHLYRPDHDGATLNGRISRLIFDAWWTPGIPTPTE
ncbi:MAG: class A beta-lactamase-related serine hydrolase [Thermomicrobia bacterium]|nr:class A beta-lactamase-related serine hydrolase [Thermomicrobia bacterium]MCA1724561.1 class A beta-lactamase-related serine hydrolase [Thermomicrobia bacterium]